MAVKAVQQEQVTGVKQFLSSPSANLPASQDRVDASISSGQNAGKFSSVPERVDEELTKA